MRRIIVFLALFSLPAFAVNYTVKAGGGGNYTTIQACATAMAAGDTCTVYAGTYSENVTVTAGTAGNYKTITVNGTDVVSVLSFTLNSHTKLVGNCPEKQGTVTTATCGFFLGNAASPGANPCVSTTTTATDVYIVHNVMYACANGIGNSSSTSGAAIWIPATGSFIYIQGNTCSYPAATVASPVLTGKCVDIGEPNTSGTSVVTNILIENNDFSHYTLGVKFSSQHSIFRNNNFHDQIESEGSSNKHTDILFSEQLFNVIDNVIEGNFERNAVGANAKGVLAQGDTPCSGCTNLIVRYDITSRIGSSVSSNYPTWAHIVQYNNTHVDLNMDGSTSGQDTDYNDGGLTNVALLNNLYFYDNTSNWTNWNSGSCGASCNAGHNLYWCNGPGTCTIPWNHIYGGSGGNWLVDPGNLHANPLFLNYASPGSTSNNYYLQSTSPARNAGTNLTTVNGTVTSSTSLVVTDAAYFQDGYSLTNANSTVSGDCISVTTVGNHVCITAVNYATNTLTLASAISATNGDPVWLYSKSDGVRVLTGTAPDMGALPYAAVSCAPPSYSCVSTSTAAVGTLTAPITGASTYNTTWFSPLNPATDCYTLLYDSAGAGAGNLTLAKIGGGNNTWSGGGNDHMGSLLNTYWGIVQTGGPTAIYHLSTTTVSGVKCAQNISQGGENPGISIGGAFSFSAAQDSVFYNLSVANASNHPAIQQNTITSDTTYTVTSNSQFPYDLNNCPGIAAAIGAYQSSTSLMVAHGDTEFVTAISWTGGQGTGHNVLVYKPGIGCADWDVANGNYYAFCNGVCNSATPAGTETVCTSSGYAGGSGIHGVQLTTQGDIVQVSGACFDQLGANNLGYWQIGTSNFLGTSDTTSSWDGNVHTSGHNSMGTTHLWITYNPSPNVRVVDPLTTANQAAYTTLTTFTGGTYPDSHGGHPLSDVFDSYPWIVDSMIVSGNSYTAPPAYVEEIYGLYASGGAIPRFGPSYNSGLAAGFGCANSIPSVSQDGRMVVFLTDILNTITSCVPVAMMLGNGDNVIAPPSNAIFVVH